MLTPPEIPEQRILDCLKLHFGINATRLTFLPLGVDADAAVYRAESDGSAWFVKLRRGFGALAVELPAWLAAQGVGHVLAPLAALDGRRWAELNAWAVIVYPFVAGQDGYARAMTREQWTAFGAAMRAVHDSALPDDLRGRVAVEGWSPVWRERLAAWLTCVNETGWQDTEAEECAAVMRTHRGGVMTMLAEADQLSPAERSLDAPLVLCHTDLHPGNLLITDNGEFYIVDWDAPLLAPRERDLMFIGAGQGFAGVTTEEEGAWFYAGYGTVDINADLLRYYRLARMIEDMALFCDDLLGGTAQDADRAASLRYLIGIVDSINRKDAKAAKKINK